MSDYTELYAVASAVTGWLDESNVPTREEMGLRILKVFEECGEVAQAWIGFTGQNPRKGVTHTKGDVVAELCDVIVTALVAIQSLGVSTKGVSTKSVVEASARVTLGRIRAGQ